MYLAFGWRIPEFVASVNGGAISWFSRRLCDSSNYSIDSQQANWIRPRVRSSSIQSIHINSLQWEPSIDTFLVCYVVFLTQKILGNRFNSHMYLTLLGNSGYTWIPIYPPMLHGCEKWLSTEDEGRCFGPPSGPSGTKTEGGSSTSHGSTKKRGWNTNRDWDLYQMSTFMNYLRNLGCENLAEFERPHCNYV